MAIQDAVCTAIKEILKNITGEPTDSVNFYRKHFKVSDKHFYPIVADAVANTLPLDTHRAHKIAEKLEIPGEFLQNSEMQKLAISALTRELDKEQIGYIDNRYWVAIKELFALTDEMLDTPEIKKKLQSWMTRNAEQDQHIRGIEIAREVFPISDEDLQIDQIQKPVQQKLLQSLRSGFLSLDIQRVYSIPASFREDTEAKTAA